MDPLSLIGKAIGATVSLVIDRRKGKKQLERHEEIVYNQRVIIRLCVLIIILLGTLIGLYLYHHTH